MSSEEDNQSPVQKIDPRHTARVLALQQLFNFYASEVNDLPDNEFSVEELMEMYEQQDYNQEMFERIVAGVKEHRSQMDKIVSKLAPLWPIEQISLIDLIILRIGIWESFIDKKIPEKVGIDEAIELAKEFAGETSAKFINGVLGNLLKNAELQAELLS